MASKRIQISFELTTEKEWRDFIKRPGLLVVDLYRDWAGPCVAMSTPLRTLKTNEFEWVHLASAPSSIVPDLRRLEGSKPTFVLLSGKRLVNVIFGCRAPDVIRIISEEIEREKRVAQGLEKRQTVSLTRLSPAEVAEQGHLLDSEGNRILSEQERAQMEADRVLRRILEQIAEHLPAATVVVVFPYALQAAEACEEILTSLRNTWAEMGFTVTREQMVELNREAVELMFWERRLPQHDVLAESVMDGASLVLMLERQEDQVEDDEEEEEVVEEEEEEEDEEEGEEGEEHVPAKHRIGVEPLVAKSIYGFLPGTGSSMELISAGLEEEEDDEEQFRLSPSPQEEDEGVDEDEEQDDIEGGKETVDPQEVAEGGDAEDEGGEAEDEGGELEDEDEGGEAEDEGGEVEDEDEGGEAEDEGGEAENEATGKASAKLEANEDADTAADGALGEEEGGEEDVQEEEDELQQDLTDEDDDDLIPQVPVRVWNPRELLPALDSAAARLLFRREGTGPVLPGIWTPLTAITKAAAVKALFEDVAEPLFEPPTPPPPPSPESTVIFFSGDKRDEVLELSQNFPSEVTRFGFFTKSRKLLASTRPDFERLVKSGLQTAKTLVVLEVTRVRSAPLLELATAGPLYVSATAGIAKADVAEFFGEKVTRANQEDLREIVMVREEVEEKVVVPARPRPPAKVETDVEGAEEGEQGEAVATTETADGVQIEAPVGLAEGEGEAPVGLGDGEGEAPAGLGDGGEGEAPVGLGQGEGEGEALVGVGDGEGETPVGLGDGEGEAAIVGAVLEDGGEAEDSSSEEQLLSGTAAGDAPTAAAEE